MRRLPVIARCTFVLAIGLAFVSPSANAEPSAGELNVGLRAEPGETAEPVRFQYAYGETEGRVESDTKIVTGILQSLPEEGPLHVIDVFAENTPEGLAEGETIAARLRGVVRSLEPQFGDRAARLAVEIVPVPKKIFVRPVAAEIRTGVLVGSYRGVNAFSSWFATPGIDPLVATSIATFQTALSTFHAVFARSISNAFSRSFNKLNPKPVTGATLFLRRQAYALLVGEVMRLISGTPPGFDSMYTLAGQAQIVTASLVIAGLDAIYMGARDKAFLHDPKHFARLYLANFILLTPWQAMEISGVFPVLLDLTVFKVRASTFGMLATYFTFYQALTHYPKQVAVALDAVFDPTERAIGRVWRTIGKSCRSLLRRAEDYGDHFRDFVR